MKRILDAVTLAIGGLLLAGWIHDFIAPRPNPWGGFLGAYIESQRRAEMLGASGIFLAHGLFGWWLISRRRR